MVSLCMSPGVQDFEVCIFTDGLQILNWCKSLIEDILTHILLTLLTFIALPILQKIQSYRRWILS